ncbi:MAG: twin-arginine translocation signal domain-containing protein, partial [Myxococcaceae bacterium]
MGSELDRRGVLQGVAAAGVAGVMGAGPTLSPSRLSACGYASESNAVIGEPCDTKTAGATC